jgi:hypothetical protein
MNQPVVLAGFSLELLSENRHALPAQPPLDYALRVFRAAPFQKEKIDNESKEFDVERNGAPDFIRVRTYGDGPG